MNPEMNAHYRQLKERGKLTGQAYIAVGNRMLRLSYAMRKNKTLYQSPNPANELHQVIARKLKTKSKIVVFYSRFVEEGMK